MDTTEFVGKIKKAIAVPSYNGRYSDDDMLEFASDEQEITINPIITSLRKEFFVVKTSVTKLSGENEIEIPVRAVGRTVRMIKFHTGASVMPLANIQIEHEHFFSSQGNGSTAGFYVEGDKLILLPTPNFTASFDLWYEKKPSKLVKTIYTATVTSVGSNYVTVNKIPSNLIIGSVCDITKATAGFVITNQDVVIQNISVLTITFTTDITNVAIGDVISLAETTSIVQLPSEASMVLAQAAAVKVLQGLDIPEQLTRAEAILAQRVKHLQEVLSPRVEGNRQKIINNNGLLRTKFNRRFPNVTV